MKSIIGHDGVSRFGFGSSQRKRVGELLVLARELTGDYFKLGQEEVEAMPFEVRTLWELKPEEIRSAGILADIFRYQYLDLRFGRKRDLYRITLQDHNILYCLREQSYIFKFSPLLLYVLTHEMIHVIRFVKFLVPFHKEVLHREAEERIVHDLTQTILARLSMKNLDKVLAYYQKEGILID